MNIFDFITPEEIDDLPTDKQMAFATFVRHARRRLSERIREIGDVQASWRDVDEARHGFMNVTIAAAKRFEIERFASIEVPLVKDISFETYREFTADLDHYLTQIILDNSERNRSNSVLLAPRAKDRIRQHIHGLKECLEQANLNDSKKAALFNKLSDFEGELEKKRLSLITVTWITLEIMALPGAIWASADIANRLVTNILTTVAEAKAAEDEARQLPPVSEPIKLSPPRTPKASEESDDPDLDDEIPF